LATTVHAAGCFEPYGPGKMWTMEIERKFLVESEPQDEPSEVWEIVQGYLALADDRGGAEVRVRSVHAQYWLTVKGGTGRARAEEEIAIERDVFDSLWELTEGRRITKTRHVIPLGELAVELDVFRGALEGLRIAEAEFPDEDAAEAFEPPAWFGPEVTGDRRYLNETLATEGAPS
jgi:CYTH domain-containing protein